MQPQTNNQTRRKPETIAEAIKSRNTDLRLLYAIADGNATDDQRAAWADRRGGLRFDEPDRDVAAAEDLDEHTAVWVHRTFTQHLTIELPIGLAPKLGRRKQYLVAEVTKDDNGWYRSDIIRMYADDEPGARKRVEYFISDMAPLARLFDEHVSRLDV